MVTDRDKTPANSAISCSLETENEQIKMEPGLFAGHYRLVTGISFDRDQLILDKRYYRKSISEQNANEEVIEISKKVKILCRDGGSPPLWTSKEMFVKILDR